MDDYKEFPDDDPEFLNWPSDTSSEEYKQQFFDKTCQDFLKSTATEILKKGYEREFQKQCERLAQIRLFENPAAFGKTVEYVMNAVASYDNKGPSFAYLITINPKPEVTMDELKLELQRVFKKKWFVHYVVAYEYRNDPKKHLPKNEYLQLDDEQKVRTGPHCHIFLLNQHVKPYSHIHREIYSTLKELVGNKKHINVKNIKQEHELQTIAYLQKDGRWEGVGKYVDIEDMPRQLSAHSLEKLENKKRKKKNKK